MHLLLIGILLGLLIGLITLVVIFIRINRGYLIVDFSLNNDDQPFLLELTTNVDEVYNSKYVLLRTIRK